MARYRVTRVYAAYRDGTHYGPWTPGEVLELDQDLADWCNRDSPGVVELVSDPKPEPEPAEGEREMPPTPNRQAKRPRTR